MGSKLLMLALLLPAWVQAQDSVLVAKDKWHRLNSVDSALTSVGGTVQILAYVNQLESRNHDCDSTLTVVTNRATEDLKVVGQQLAAALSLVREQGAVAGQVGTQVEEAKETSQQLAAVTDEQATRKQRTIDRQSTWLKITTSVSVALGTILYFIVR